MSVKSNFKSNNGKLSGDDHRFIRLNLAFLFNKISPIKVSVKDFSFVCAHSNYGLEYEYPYGYVMVLLYEDNLKVSFSFDHDNLFQGINSFFYNLNFVLDNDFNYISANVKNGYNIAGVRQPHDTFSPSFLEVFYLFDEHVNCSVIMNWQIAQDPLVKHKLNEIPELAPLFIFNKDLHYYFNYYFSKYRLADGPFYSVFENSHPSIVNKDINSFVDFLLSWINLYGQNLNLLKKDLSILDMALF